MNSFEQTQVSGIKQIEENVDARPALPVSDNSLWELAGNERDILAKRIEKEFKKKNIEAWIRKSKPGEYPIYLVVDSWKKVSESEVATTFDRSSLKITITVSPYLEHHINYEIELKRHRKSFTGEYWGLPQGELAELIEYLIQGGGTPKFFKSRVDPFTRVIGAFLPFIGNEPKNKLISEVRPRRLIPENIFGWGGAVALCVFLFTAVSESGEYYSQDMSTYILLCLLSAVAMFGGIWISHRRPTFDAIPKQSLRVPRREFIIDSWHVSVPGAGRDFELFKNRIYDVVIRNDPTIESEVELHQNLTPRGFEERERLVLTKGQATLHLHVYPYSENAFVGWESYLNWKRWGEGKEVSSTVKEDGNRVSYRTLISDIHIPSDFDLIDLNVLSETVHRVLIKEVKSFLKEREIEEDLDFTIIRGDRSKALTEGNPEKKSTK